MNKSVPIWVVIPAAGIGSRMQADRPKQYLMLDGKTVLEHTLSCFQVAEVAGLVVVVSESDTHWAQLDMRPFSIPIHCTRIQSGLERAHSVLRGLEYLRDLQVSNEALVLVHDAARPCLRLRDLHQLIAVASTQPQGALLAYPVRDTMKRAIETSPHGSLPQVSHTESRIDLWHALTPQAASLGSLLTVLTQALAAQIPITDEASALEWSGLHPILVEGDAWNIKITRPSDLSLARLLIQLRGSASA